MKTATLNRIGNYSFISAIFSFGLLLIVLYLPSINNYLQTKTIISLLGISILLFGGIFFVTTLGLCVFISGELYLFVIPGILQTRLHPLVARILGLTHLLIGVFAVFISIIVLLVAIFARNT